MSSTMTQKALSRRSFIQSGIAFGGALTTGARWSPAMATAPALKVYSRTIEVNRQAAKVFSVAAKDGAKGILANEGDRLSGSLFNATDEPLQVHWHGQIKAPYDQDRARPGGGAILPGQSDAHDFELTAGTHWMHSHTLSEQQMLAAPMVAREKDAGDVQDVVLMLHDFAFRSPQEILAELGGQSAHAGHDTAAPSRAQPMPPAMPGMPHGPGMMHAMPGPGNSPMMMGTPHANDVRYDAYLANDRTLDDPEVVNVDRGGRVRLRVINGGTATAFFISMPGLIARCVSVDGTPCQPVEATTFPIAQGQRIDLVAEIPGDGGAFPVLAQVEASQFVTGIVLATPGATIRKLATSAEQTSGMVDLGFESQIRAVQPLSPKQSDKAYMVMLGEEPGYRWTINGRVHGEHQPFEVRLGERVEMTFMNPTMMMHPMHLHGHHFQVLALGGRRLSGAVRDTVIVPPHAPVTIAFDAAQRGAWLMHCHHLYHMATGMMTEVRIV